MESESRKEMESVDHQAELLTLHEEIMSLVSERNNLLASLTPNLFVWEDQSDAARRPAFNSQQQVREEESASTWRIAGKASVQKMDSSLTEPAAVSGSRPTWQPEQLENYWDSILQDMEDLGHRMLSIADDNINSRELDDPISMYKKAEMFATASRLVQISQDLSNSTNAAVGGQAEEMVTEAVDSCEKKVAATFARLAREEAFAEDARGEAWARDARGQAHAEGALNAEENMALSNGFLRLCNNYFERPNTYRKHLALIITTEEEKEMEMEKEKEKEEEEEKEKVKAVEKAKAVEKEKEKER
jgi:hypothetical protein